VFSEFGPRPHRSFTVSSCCLEPLVMANRGNGAPALLNAMRSVGPSLPSRVSRISVADRVRSRRLVSTVSLPVREHQLVGRSGHHRVRYPWRRSFGSV
jgi:hypothetical protein